MKVAGITVLEARRLALLRAGLLRPQLLGLPRRAGSGERRARRAALRLLRHFGYLQLDSVTISGARSHVQVLLSRLEGFPSPLGEELLRPGEPLFEYWGHEVSWLPLELYPTFAFRREQYRVHPWWGDLLGQHRELADEILARIAAEGPLRSIDLEGTSATGWWQHKLAKRVAEALWTAGDLAIRQRSGFQRSYDLVERVVPHSLLRQEVPRSDALPELLLLALGGHGWATSSTLANTWRLRNLAKPLAAALQRLVEEGRITRCHLQGATGRHVAGWIQPADLDLLPTLRRLRPPRSQGVLLSPFDPALWDRGRVRLLFQFEQVLEIFKPAAKRRWGYYCLPVLAGDRLIARLDLKAHRQAGRLEVLGAFFEAARPTAGDRQAVATALARHGESLQLSVPHLG